MSTMKYIKLLILISYVFELNGQVIKDSFSDIRDVTFFNFNNNGKSISLGRILKNTEGGKIFSVREGKEILVSYIDGEISYYFEEIDGYSSLFFEEANFEILDLDNDGFKELIIEIEPFESYKNIWIYSLRPENKFEFITKKQLISYKIIDENIIKIKTSLFCKEWGDCIYETLTFDEKIDFNKLIELNFYCFEKSKLIKVNHLYQFEYEKLKSDYRNVLNQIKHSNLVFNTEFHQEKLEKLKNELKQVISPTGAKIYSRENKK